MENNNKNQTNQLIFQVSQHQGKGRTDQNTQGWIYEGDWPLISIKQQSHKLAKPGTHLEKHEPQLSLCS